jgi:hypothetical protein
MMWISVANRLPPHTTEVLVYCAGARHVGFAWRSSDGWRMPEPQSIGYDMISHWMPLPPHPAMAPTGEKP